jgi:hypothetical protein
MPHDAIWLKKKPSERFFLIVIQQRLSSIPSDLPFKCPTRQPPEACVPGGIEFSVDEFRFDR